MSKFKTKTIRTRMNGSQRKIERLVAKGWEVVSVTRYGWSSNIITFRKSK